MWVGPSLSLNLAHELYSVLRSYPSHNSPSKFHSCCHSWEWSFDKMWEGWHVLDVFPLGIVFSLVLYTFLMLWHPQHYSKSHRQIYVPRSMARWRSKGWGFFGFLGRKVTAPFLALYKGGTRNICPHFTSLYPKIKEVVRGAQLPKFVSVLSPHLA